MDQLFLDLPLHSLHILFPILGVEVELVVVLADAELATNALAAELADAHDFFR
jgi:hypothetical protein